MVNKIDWEFYLISAIITFIILLAGIFFGMFIGKEKVSSLEQNLEDLRVRQDDATLSFSLMSIFGNKSCSIIQHELGDTMTQAAELGKEITSYQNEKFKDEGYIQTKKDYTLIQIRYWSYLERLKQECNNTNFITILYFYSGECGDCSKQGLILDYLKQTHPNNVMNFALDYDVDLNVIRLLKSVYNVTTTPTLIINDKKYTGLVELCQLEEVLCKDFSICKMS